MTENFNTYIDSTAADFWRNLCINEGELRKFSKGEDFVSSGSVARFIDCLTSQHHPHASEPTAQKHLTSHTISTFVEN